MKIRHREIIIWFQRQKQNLGDHRFKDDREVETVMTSWLKTKDTGLISAGNTDINTRYDKMP
jgi:hypothetical protein